jgi:hypothetical protein
MTELSIAPRPARDEFARDPKDPLGRLSALFDPGTLVLPHEPGEVSTVARLEEGICH